MVDTRGQTKINRYDYDLHALLCLTGLSETGNSLVAISFRGYVVGERALKRYMKEHQLI